MVLVTTKVYKVLKLLVIAVQTEKLAGSILKGALQNINILYVYTFASVCMYLDT